jgi:hypothetical protein
MANKVFYIQYLANSVVKVETHFKGEDERQRPLADISFFKVQFVPLATLVSNKTSTFHICIIAAYKSKVVPLLDNCSLAHLFLKLPVGNDRSGVSKDCFWSEDEDDTTLHPRCPLSALLTLGSLFKQPLVLELNNPGMLNKSSFNSN